ncbi:hypothetical protein SALBM311S_00681 [Streptomyces alboniger]
MAVVDLVVDRREGDRDVLAGFGVLDAEGFDQLGGQHLLLFAAGADVVHLGEQDRVVARRLHVDGGRRGPGDLQVLREGRRLERGELAREVEGDPDTERGQLGETAGGATDSGKAGDGGRAGAGRVLEALLASGEGDRAEVAPQAGVGVRVHTAQPGLTVAGAGAEGAGDAEGRAGVGALVVLEVPVEPGGGPGLDTARLHVATVVPARDPVDVDGGAVGPDGLRRRVGLAEREEGVGLALQQERGHLDAVADGGRRALVEELHRLGVGGAGLGDPLVHPAQLRLELGAAAA